MWPSLTCGCRNWFRHRSRTDPGLDRCRVVFGCSRVQAKNLPSVGLHASFTNQQQRQVSSHDATNRTTGRGGTVVRRDESGRFRIERRHCPGRALLGHLVSGPAGPGGFTEVDWDWTTCHKYNLVHRGMPPQVVGMTAEDGWYGGHPHYRTVAGENTNATCQFLGCP